MDLDANHWVTTTTADQLLAMDEALSKLGQEDPLAAQLVKLRYFAGMSVEEAADVLDVSRTTAYRHWTYARAWIRAKVKAGSGSSDTFGNCSLGWKNFPTRVGQIPVFCRMDQ